MGNCGGGMTKAEKDERSKSLAIERALAREKRQQTEVKLLLLGAGESGKSTIAKQMKIIHLGSFTDIERQAYKTLIYINIITAIQTLINQTRKRNLPISEQLEPFIDEIMAISLIQKIEYTKELAEQVYALWQDASIQTVYHVANEFALSDSAPYFLDNAVRFSDPNYLVTEIDILRVRAKTTGIIETVFIVQKVRFRMVDVGGQRNERKKWIHCFQDVTAILFCASLNDYDLVLEEDETVNRMHESLNLWETTVKSRWFGETDTILFLNKVDLFEEKIKRKDLTCCFPNYEGGLDFEKAKLYIQDKFIKAKEGGAKTFTHFTCATDTQNVRVVFTAVQQILLDKILVEIM